MVYLEQLVSELAFLPIETRRGSGDASFRSANRARASSYFGRAILGQTATAMASSDTDPAATEALFAFKTSVLR